MSRNGRDHELLVERHDELDEKVVEVFILVQPRLLYELVQMVDKLLIDGPHIAHLQPLNSTDFIEEPYCLVSELDLVYPCSSGIAGLCSGDLTEGNETMEDGMARRSLQVVADERIARSS